jgi:hypothetical protein
MIDCIKNKNVKINDYCETCKILVNFTTELYEKMLLFKNTNENGLNDLECVDVNTYIPLCRDACESWCNNIENVSEKQSNIDFELNNNDIISNILYDMPENNEERKEFIKNLSGIVTVQISKAYWFQIIYKNILKCLTNT